MIDIIAGLIPSGSARFTSAPASTSTRAASRLPSRAANSIGASFRPYADTGEIVRQSAFPYVEVPVGVAVYPGDSPLPARAYAERHFNVQRWTVLPRGGHFAALEVPDLWVEETRAFFARNGFTAYNERLWSR